MDERKREVERRTQALRELLARRGLAGAVLSRRYNFAWLTEGGDDHVLGASEEGVAALVVTERELSCLTTVIERARIEEEELAGLGIAVRAVPWERAALVPLGGASALPERFARDDDLEADLSPLRSRLSRLDEEELGRLGALAEEALAGVLASARPGDLEMVLAARTAERLAAHGANAPVLLVAGDERIATYRHPIPTTKPVARSLELVLVAERRGLHVALTRMAWLVGKPDAETERRLEASRAVERAMHETTRPGRTLGDVLEAGIRAYAAAGFAEEWRLHHQGGTIGYRSREAIAVPGDRREIANGMAFAWNPSVTGTKVEDTLLLRSDGRREVVTRR